MTEPQQPPIELKSERQVFANDFVAVYEDDVLFGSAFPGRYVRIVERDGQPGAAVLARSAGRYALVLSYRYPTGEFEWGIPRGFAHGDDPALTAHNELAEELGGTPSSLTELGTVTPNSGILAGRAHLYLAEFDQEVSAPVDTDEILQVRWVELQDLLAEIADGRLKDAFTLSAITLAAARGLLDAVRR